METKTITIHGYDFRVPLRYAPGHICTLTEANVLNQKMVRNVSQIFWKRIAERGSLSLNDVGTVQNDIIDFSLSYSFGTGRDPVADEALAIAEAVVRKRIKDQKGNITDYTKASIAQQAKIVLGSSVGAEIIALARKRVVELQAAAKAVSEGGLGL